jgi:very-short-patch-repair endonuclease
MYPDVDDLSNFRSAIEWPEMRPPTEEVTGDFKWLGEFLPAVLEFVGSAYILAPECESPIEVELGARLSNALSSVRESGLSLVPQFRLGTFRYDFAIMREGKTIALVECDGKDYHSTAEQIANDRKKDSLAAKRDAMLFRFSGSDIFRNGKFCVYTIVQNLRDQGYLTQEQWDLLKGQLSPRPFSVRQLESDELE